MAEAPIEISFLLCYSKKLSDTVRKKSNFYFVVEKLKLHFITPLLY